MKRHRFGCLGRSLLAWSYLSAVAGAQVQITSSPSLASTPSIVAFGTDLYMAVDTGSGRQLHRFDTISRTTTPIVDSVTLQPVVSVQDPTVAGARVFFRGSSTGGSFPTLYVHAPAAGNTALRLVASNLDPTQLAASGARLFCSGVGAGGREPWVSDGTIAGTVRIANLNPSGDSNPQDFVAFGGGAIFRANDGSNGVEPWFTNGVSCTLLEVHATAGSSPAEFVVAGSFCYFSATDGIHGREVWRTNGTGAGTTLIDVRAGTTGSDPTGLAAIGADLYFAANGGIGHGVELWRITGSSGTAAEVWDIRAGSNSSSPSGLERSGPLLYFAATSSNAEGRELFVYDPSGGGAQLTVQPGGADGVQADPRIAALGAGGTIVFEGDGGASGFEPWTTSGVAVTNAANLALVGSSNPEQFTPIGSEVFFVGTNQTGNGVQVWAMPFSGLPSAIWSVRGVGCARAGGTVPTAALTAPPRLGTTPSLVTQGAPGLGLVVSFASTGIGAQAIGPCTVWVATGPGQPVSLPVVFANGAGTATLPLPIPGASSLIGFRLVLQSLVIEAGGAMFGIGALSNAVDAFVGT